jgi:hypothetical protein
MADPTPARRKAVIIVVLAIAIIVLGTFVLIGVLEGDNTDQIDPQNGEVVTLLR